MTPNQLIDGYQCVFLFKTIRYMIDHCRTYLYWLSAGGSARGKQVVILRGQILVRPSGDLIDGSIMAPIQSIDVYQCVFLFKSIRFMIDSSLQDLFLLTLWRRQPYVGEAGSDFTWADLSKAQWGLDWWIHYGPHSTAGTWTNCSSAILLYMLCLPSLGSAYLYREVFCIFCWRYGQIGISNLLFRLGLNLPTYPISHWQIYLTSDQALWAWF